MDSIVHFEIPADDVGRAQKFYSEIFSWKMNSMPEMGYTIVHTAETDERNMIQEPGKINGGMLKRQAPVTNPTLIIDVQSIDETVKKIEDAGGKIIREKLPVGDMGFVAYFTDSEGNTLGLWETAKQ